MQSNKKFGRIEKVFLGGLFLVVLTVTPYSVMDPMNLPKMTILGIFGLTLLGFSFNGELLNRARQQKGLTFLGLLFAFDGLLVLILAPRTINEGLFGVSGRNTGFLTYFGFTIVLLVAAQLTSAPFIKNFIYVFITIGVILSGYGVIQHLGLEPFPYVNIYENNVFGTFGNPNFQSAFMGIFSALLFGLALNESDQIQKRLLMGSLSIVGVYGVLITKSWQGFFNFAAGAGVAIVLNLFRKNKEKLGFILLGFGSALAILVVLGLFNQGPIASALAKASLSARRIYWEAAVRMLLDNPFFGVGWDGFGDWFRRSRSADAVKFNSALVSDSAHSVPLDVASSGGIALLFLYLSFILLGVLAVIKVVKSKRELSVNYIALVAAWSSYQAQSLISINQIGLGVIGWSLTGLVIGYAYIERPENKLNNERLSQSIARKQTQDFSFNLFFAPLVGLIIGCLVYLPPFISANKFYEGMKTSDARVINTNAYLHPFDLRRMLIAADVLERNKFFKESHQIGLVATQNFPDSFEAWTFLGSLTNTTDVEKAKANEELHRLDPNLK